MSFLRWAWKDAPGLVLFIVAVIALVAYVEIGTTTTQTRCIAKGYPNYYVTWTLDRFCIKRVNQSDVVVPLDSLERVK